MNKRIVLSLLIMSPAFMHAMENNFSSLSSFLFHSFIRTRSSTSQLKHESKLISDLRTIKNTFENQLQLDKQIEKQKAYMEFTLPLFSMYSIDATPVQFLHYCYYQKFHTSEFVSLSNLGNQLRKKCQSVQIDGYSALGAAIIAKDTPIKKKREFIQQLIKRGFKPTPKDIDLEKLILYDEITKESKPMLHILYSAANWSVLPQEIRKWITQYMIQLFKNERLLPGTSLNDF